MAMNGNIPHLSVRRPSTSTRLRQDTLKNEQLHHVACEDYQLGSRAARCKTVRLNMGCPLPQVKLLLLATSDGRADPGAKQCPKA